MDFALLKDNNIVKALSKAFKEGKNVNSYVLQCEKQLADNLLTWCADVVLCKNFGCNDCLTCRKVFSGNHLDVFRLPNKLKEKNTDKMEIADVRFLLEEEEKRPVEGDKKVFLINACNSLKGVAVANWQNALLKTLEEPHKNVYIFIAVENAQGLLPTIISRCQVLTCQKTKEEEIVNYLSRQGCTQKVAQLATLLCDGSLPKAEEVVADTTYLVALEEVIQALKTTTSTKNALPFVAFLHNHKDDVDKYFQIITAVLMQTLHYRLHQEKFVLSSWEEEVCSICAQYSIQAVLAVTGLVEKAKKDIDSSVNFSVVVDNLVADVLEVKFRCQI